MSIGSADSQGAGPPLPATNAPADPLRGVLESALGAQYDVLRLLGRGGMGAVYLARERLLDRLVAIKVLPSERADAESRERFLREARTAALLTHPNIVPLLSFGEQGDTLFYIMRFVEGESLESRLRREGALPFTDTRRILSELCDALGYAHEQGVVHRDIKPDNVLIERGTGRVMLADFGVARRRSAASTLTSTGMIVGTPQYMSPEQASGEREVDGRSDLYALGVIGYRMLTGRLPFAGDSVRELLVQQMTGAPRPVGEVVADSPVDLAAAVMRCLAKEPGERWADAASLRHAIAASSVNDIALPDELDRLPRLGTRILAWSYVFLVSMLFIRLFDADAVWLRLGTWGPLLGLTLALGSQVVAAARHGIAWRRTLHMAFWPPRDWSGWWPRRLRPPGDVWDRLPGTVRAARLGGITALTVLFGGITLPVLFALIIWGQRIRPWSPLAHQLLVNVWMLSALTPFATFLASYFALQRFGRQRGLAKAEVSRLMAEPTLGSRFWERPSISRLLRGEQPMVKTPSTETELAAAVRALAGSLAPSMNTLASEAQHAADELLAAIRSLDRQCTELTDSAEIGERRRIEDRLAALGAAHDDEPAAKRQMRVLLESQRSLLEEMEGRREALMRRRGLLAEHLRVLWMQMANLGVQAALPSAEPTELSDRILALCRGIEDRVRAIDEAERLIRS